PLVDCVFFVTHSQVIVHTVPRAEHEREAKINFSCGFIIMNHFFIRKNNRVLLVCRKQAPIQAKPSIVVSQSIKRRLMLFNTTASAKAIKRKWVGKSCG